MEALPDRKFYFIFSRDFIDTFLFLLFQILPKLKQWDNSIWRLHLNCIISSIFLQSSKVETQLEHFEELLVAFQNELFSLNADVRVLQESAVQSNNKVNNRKVLFTSQKGLRANYVTGP